MLHYHLASLIFATRFHFGFRVPLPRGYYSTVHAFHFTLALHYADMPL